MNKIDEIFKNNPQLLNEPEVQELIKHCETVYSKTVQVCNNYKNFHDEVLEILMYSENFLVKGKSIEESFKKIEEAFLKF